MSANNLKKFYVSDLDGTLLRDDATLSAFSRDKLIELIDSGVNFSVASARSIVALKPILEGVPFKLPIIEINGAFITDFTTGDHIIINEMPKSIIEEVFNRIVAHNCLPFLSAFDGTQDRLYYSDIINGGMDWYLSDRKINSDHRVTQVADLPSTFERNIVAFTAINTYENLVALADEMKGAYSDALQMHFFENPYSPKWYWLTIHDKKACKSHAIRELLDYANVKLDELVVFGDNLNDVNMFRMAATAVAVQNATDEIKSYATTIIGTNNEDSVVKYIAEKEFI